MTPLLTPNRAVVRASTQVTAVIASMAVKAGSGMTLPFSGFLDAIKEGLEDKKSSPMLG